VLNLCLLRSFLLFKYGSNNINLKKGILEDIFDAKLKPNGDTAAEIGRQRK
jgi:hypothetical protein